MEAAATASVLEVRDLETRLAGRVVHAGVNLEVRRREIFAIVGGSGSGKSTLLREAVMLRRPDAGSIRLLGRDTARLDEEQARELRRRFGVMFQHGSLFGSLNLLANIALPLREHTGLPDRLIEQIALFKLKLTGLPVEAATLYPAELSGGMQKRASLARALALDPEVLFLDEPTAGLDPAAASGVDLLVQQLRSQLGLTIVIITHDLDLLWQVADRVAVLGAGRIQGVGTMAELSAMEHPAIRQFFDTPRGRAVRK